MEAADSSEFLYAFTKLYGFTSQSIVIFISTDMITAKLTQEWHVQNNIKPPQYKLKQTVQDIPK